MPGYLARTSECKKVIKMNVKSVKINRKKVAIFVVNLLCNVLGMFKLDLLLIVFPDSVCFSKLLYLSF